MTSYRVHPPLLHLRAYNKVHRCRPIPLAQLSSRLFSSTVGIGFQPKLVSNDFAAARSLSGDKGLGKEIDGRL